ncbi:MAG: hypothetical protein LBL97_07075 [Prevotellaceae bacterium]|jgi:hypothetical protein|nr:hypothetical protein [Prevotellaceae bacterium]
MKLQDTFFSMPRFVNLCRKEMVESWRAYLLRVSMIYGAFAILLVWNSYFKYRVAPQLPDNYAVYAVRSFTTYTFIWFLFIMGSVSASFMMERMKRKTGRIHTLMTPATPFEQFFSRWLILTFGFLAAFLIAYTLGDWTRVLIYRMVYPSLSGVIEPVSVFTIIRQIGLVGLIKGDLDIWTALSLYLFVQSFFVLGSSLWPRHALVRTFVAGVSILIAYMLVGMGTFYAFEPDNFRGGVSFSEQTAQMWMNIFLSVMVVVNWTLAYFRFKESEIINRW